jgi:hypothetical protein
MSADIPESSQGSALITGVSARRVNVSIACRGSKLPGMPSASSLRMVLSPNMFAHDGICYLCLTTAKR